VDRSAPADGDQTQAPHPLRLTFEEMQDLLRQWEALDQIKWGDEERMECADALETMDLTLDQWKELLIEVKPDVPTRYRKVIGMLLKSQHIDQEAHDAELKVMDQFSPATLTRRGKMFAEWYRQPVIALC